MCAQTGNALLNGKPAYAAVLPGRSRPIPLSLEALEPIPLSSKGGLRIVPRSKTAPKVVEIYQALVVGHNGNSEIKFNPQKHFVYSLTVVDAAECIPKLVKHLVKLERARK